MKFKIGQLVYDKWWPIEIGKVVDVQKTRIKVLFFSGVICNKTVTYDKNHIKFLDKLEN